MPLLLISKTVYSNILFIVLQQLQQIIQEQTIMNQAQSKRTKFRQEIRKKHVSQLFSTIRKAHKERQQNSQPLVLDAATKQTIMNQLQQFVCTFVKNLNNKQYNAIQKQLFHMYERVAKNPSIFSICFNQYLKRFGEKVISNQKDDVQPHLIEQLKQHLNIQSEGSKIQQQNEYEHQNNVKTVNQLMKISQMIQYNKFSKQSAILILKPIWNVLYHNYHIPKQKSHNPKQQLNLAQNPQIQILNSTCKSLHNLLDSTNHQVMKTHLRKMGLSKKLNQIIGISGIFPIQVHTNILKLVHVYNRHSNTQIMQNHNHDIGGVTIISVENQNKSIYAAYCINFLLNHRRSLYQLSLQCLDQIFEQYPYFIQLTKANYYPKILQLVLDPQRSINVSALQILNTLTFYSESASDQLVQDGKILQCMYQRLMMEKLMPVADAFTKKSVQKCSYILCDLLLTKNQKLKRVMFKHHVWELIFQSLQENNRLFGTAIVFKYFFISFNRKQRSKILPSFLEAVSRLPLQNEAIPEIKDLKQTLLNTFYHSMEHSPEEEHQQLLRLYQQNGLLKYIQVYEQGIQKI